MDRILKKYGITFNNESGRYSIGIDHYELSINTQKIVIGQHYIAEIALYNNGTIISDKIFNNCTENSRGIVSIRDLDYCILNEIFTYIKK